MTGRPAPNTPLTERELEVLRLLADGRTKAEVAEHLWISRPTVATHSQHACQKLGVANVTAAIATLARTGQLDPSDRPDSHRLLLAAITCAVEAAAMAGIPRARILAAAAGQPLHCDTPTRPNGDPR
jgi:DNA-binding CsgD family transcriptional regulator